jgi:hypothetical protein
LVPPGGSKQGHRVHLILLLGFREEGVDVGLDPELLDGACAVDVVVDDGHRQDPELGFVVAGFREFSLAAPAEVEDAGEELKIVFNPMVNLPKEVIFFLQRAG